MAFDPDAYLAEAPAPAAPAAAFDPDAYLGAPAAPPARATSTAESVERGVLQGGTLGFGDELAAAIDAGISKIPGVRAVAQKLNTMSGGSGAGLPLDDPSLTYEQRRDAYRGANAASQAQHPIAHGVGEIAGAVGTASAIPLPAGGGVTGALKGGALAGGAAGVGTSEATDLQGGLFDAAIGSLVGAGAGAAFHGAASALTGGIGRAGAESAERGVERAVDKLGAGAYKRTRAGVKSGGVEELVRESPALRKAAGDDPKVAATIARARDQAHTALDEVYSTTPQEVSPANAVANMDAKIAELAKGTSEQREVSRALKAVRDEFQGAHGDKHAITPRELRAEQSAYQKKGYGKAMPGDDAATARIAANREASKAVGDAVMKHVTGMDFAEAKAAAAADPGGTAAKLLKANKQLSAIHKIEAAIADRASKAQPKPGLIGKVAHAVEHPVKTALSAVPRGMEAADELIARAAPRGAPAPAPDENLARFVAAARGGNPFAQRVIETLARTPAGAARIAAMAGVQQ